MGQIIAMKKYLVIVVLITLYLQSLTKAEDISDFQIEGMSIGDSLLNYFDENILISNTAKKTRYKNKRYTYLMLNDENNEYNFGIYDAVYVHYQSMDKKYLIRGISGILSFEDDISNCHSKMNEIDIDLSRVFKYLEISKGRISNHEADPSGKSKIKSNLYSSKDGWHVSLQCYDWSEQIDYADHLRITIRDNDYSYFLEHEAYN